MSTADSPIDPNENPANRTPWVLFLVITVVFFITSHDLLRNSNALFRGTEEFNPSAEEAMEILATAETGQTYKAITYLAFGAFSVLSLLAFQRFRPAQIRGIYGRLAIAFIAWCGLSLFWSFDYGITTRKLAILLMLFIGAAATAQRFRIQDIAGLVVFSGTIYLLLGIGSELYLGTLRPWVGGYRFSGTIHPNGQGMNCAILLLAALFLAAREERLRVPLLGIAVFAAVFLLLTKSRTPIGTIAAVIVIYGVLSLPGSLKLALATLTVAVLAVIPIFQRVLDSLLNALYLMGRTDIAGTEAKNLSGRAELWEQCWVYIQESPFLGFGYNSFWTLDNTQDIAQKIDWFSGSAHSVYLDLLLGLGVVGLVLYVLLLLGGVARFMAAYKLTSDPAYAFVAVLLLFSMVHGIMESAFLFPAMYMFLINVLFARAAFVEESIPEDAEDFTPESADGRARGQSLAGWFA